MMSGIGNRDTRPELRLRRALHALGYRFRVHKTIGTCKPDMVLTKYKAVVFVHGCFWHRHAGCRFTTTPGTRTDFWLDKFDKNQIRDQRNYDTLAVAGWRVAIIWECALKKEVSHQLLCQLSAWLESNEARLEIPDQV